MSNKNSTFLAAGVAYKRIFNNTIANNTNADNSNNNGGGMWKYYSLYGALWAMFATIFICAPFIVSSRTTRQRCWNRLRGTSNTNSEDDEEDGSDDGQANTQMESMRMRAANRGSVVPFDNNNVAEVVAVSEDNNKVAKEAYLADIRNVVIPLLRNFTMELGGDDFHHGISHTQIEASSSSLIKLQEKGLKSDLLLNKNHLSEAGIDLELGFTSNPTSRQSTCWRRNSSMTSAGTAIRLLLPPPGQQLTNISQKQKMSMDNSESQRRLSGRGGAADDETTSSRRLAPNNCAICLDGFSLHDEVTWSSNTDCQHVFHKECLVSWLVTRKQKKDRQDSAARNRNQPNSTTFNGNVNRGNIERRGRGNNDVENNHGGRHGGERGSGNEEQQSYCELVFTCPCCRQPFIDMTNLGNVEDEETGSQNFETAATTFGDGTEGAMRLEGNTAYSDAYRETELNH